jgi:hypothetical protein
MKRWIAMFLGVFLLAACGQANAVSETAAAPTETRTSIPTFTRTSTITQSPTITMTLTPTITVTPVIANSATPTDTPTLELTAVPSVSPTIGFVFTPANGACVITATGTATMFSRPSGRADVYGYMNPGETHTANMFTRDGFVGFDAGVQHANEIGIFRERWVWVNAPILVQGNCGSLEEVVGPFPGVCYAVAGNNTRIYRTPDTNSDLETTMHYGDYVMAIGRKGSWVQVDGSVGSLYTYRLGWIMANQFIPNGPCSSV